MSLRNWVRELYALRKDIRLLDMFIPGSHDSGTYRMLTYHQNWARTQDLSVYDQLAIGTRYLDIRLSRIGGEYYVMHTFMYIPFTTVIDDINRFVGETGEIVLMRILEDFRNRVEYDNFLPNVLGYMAKFIKFSTNLRGDLTLGAIFAGTDRVFVAQAKKSLYSVWANTMSESVLYETFSEEIVVPKGSYGPENVINFDYIYTIDAGYIAGCYLALVVPAVLVFSLIAYGVWNIPNIPNIPSVRDHVDSRTYISVCAVLGAIAIFGLGAIVPLIAMPHLGSQAKSFIGDHIDTPGILPHMVSYDYVDGETNRLVIQKNFVGMPTK